MASNSRKTTPIEIVFDLTEYPDTSALMNALHKKGFDQNLIELKLPTIKVKGQFAGSLNIKGDNGSI